jgi:DNA-binding helix-hairpin-helix protein with protein kinase domain
MAQENKFNYHITQDGDKWNAEITRRVSARRTNVSKRKKGFETEQLAELWAKEQLVGFIENLQAATKRKSEKRVVRNELAAKAEAEKIAAAALYEEKRLAAFAANDDDEDLE